MHRPLLHSVPRRFMWILAALAMALPLCLGRSIASAKTSRVMIPTVAESCGDGILNLPGETCDPPGSPAGPNGNICRADCTVCGDGILDAGELCDDGNAVDTDSCPNRCFPHECGDGIVDPGETCDPPGSPAGGNGNTCRQGCTVCGDGILNAGEACDDGNGVDTDGCPNCCAFCHECGDGIVDTGETCDPPGSPAGPNGNICRVDCTVCGDGILSGGEACDDGNSNNSDACRNNCVLPVCGDGILDAGETCEPPGSPAGANGNICRADCSVCGDGILDAGEACDDGNTNNFDSCPNYCSPDECGIFFDCFCGDGILGNTPGETCDPPGAPAGPNGNICRADCSVCGDGILDAGELCDDGNTNNTDACGNNCFIDECGSGIIFPGETCDPPGAPAGPNGNICRADCSMCGDGIFDSGEACDDGNTNNTDACRNDCTLPRCGDGIVDEDEDCDDGNDVAGDGCENDCTPTPSEAICRSPGFWGTHAGVEKTRSKNITEAVIDCADGNCADHTANDYLLICGEKIDSPDSNPADGTTDWNDAASSTEALCVPVKGAQILQLARQLTAAALNCILSNGDETCASTPLYATAFADCNTTCAASTATKEELTACIGELDCLNNGRTFINGLCLDPVPGNCSEQQLVNVAQGLDFEPPGPAGSPDACQAAHATKCNVVGAAEGPPHDGAHCGTDSLP